jgi:hypothetical protein
MAYGVGAEIVKLRGELRLIERAVKQGWQTPPDEQERCVTLVVDALRSPKRREAMAALRVLTAIIEHSGVTDGEIRKRAQDALRNYRADHESAVPQ